MYAYSYAYCCCVLFSFLRAHTSFCIMLNDFVVNVAVPEDKSQALITPVAGSSPARDTTTTIVSASATRNDEQGDIRYNI